MRAFRTYLVTCLTLIMLAELPHSVYGQTATYSWSGYTAGATSYTTGIMIATVTLTSVTMQNSSPKYYAAGTVGSGQCGIAGGLALECLFGNITSANVNMMMDFTNGNTQDGTCASVKFIIEDINADESVQTFADWVVISAVDGNNTAIPAANITINQGSNTTVTTSGSTKIIKGYNGSYGARSTTACNTTTVTVTPPAGITLATITLNYHPDYTACASCYYNFTGPTRPAYQYISIGQLNATVTAGCTVTLPIELTSFTGTCSGDSKTFEWETSSEKNNKLFNVEGSYNGIDYVDLVQVNGAGNSETTQKYKLSTATSMYQYFRLKQTDLNGKTWYSRAIYVACQNKVTELMFFPNPAEGMVSTTFENRSDQPVEVIIMNSIGSVIKKFESNLVQGTNHVDLDISDLPAGMYYVEFYDSATKANLRPGRFVKN